MVKLCFWGFSLPPQGQEAGKPAATVTQVGVYEVLSWADAKRRVRKGLT